MKGKSSNICLIILALFTSSCGSAAFTMQPVSTATDPTLSATTPLRVTSTISPVPTTAPGIEATLDSTEARNTIATYLDTGGDCNNPCFLGIYPGKTTISEMKEILVHFGLPIWKNNNKSGIDFYAVDYDINNSFSLIGTIIAQGDLVENLVINIGLEGSGKSLARNWSTFSPETLIRQYGTPSKVTLAIDLGPQPYFEMNVYFYSMDLIVEYSSTEAVTSRFTTISICPLNTSFDSIRVWMGRDPRYPPPEAVSLENATSLTMGEFAELMTGNPDQACFTMNRDAFP